MEIVNLEDKKIKVVYVKSTGKMLPFAERENGEIEILTTGAFDWDDVIVGMVSTKRIDWLDGYVREEGVTVIEEE